MPRVIRHPEVRRAEFLDCAEALFLNRGYDSVSLNDVIAASGTSKGAFYHYFTSKEALLEALTERFARQVLSAAQGGDDEQALAPLARLNAFFSRARRFKVNVGSPSCGALGALFRADNSFLAERVNAAVSALFVPVLARIIEDGIRAGDFTATDPEGVAEMVLQFSASLQKIIARADPSRGEEGLQEAIGIMEKRLTLYGIALDRLLGLPDGSIQLIEPGYVHQMTVATLIPAAARS